MDGSGRTFFVKDNIGWPNGLTIDYPSSRLYWVDARLKVIESISLDGTDRRVGAHDNFFRVSRLLGRSHNNDFFVFLSILQTVLRHVATHPYSIAIFENKLYWSDWSTNSIHSCNKFNGKNYTTLFQKNETVYGIHIYHSSLKVKVRFLANYRNSYNDLDFVFSTETLASPSPAPSFVSCRPTERTLVPVLWTRSSIAINALAKVKKRKILFVGKRMSHVHCLSYPQTRRNGSTWLSPLETRSSTIITSCLEDRE